MKNASLKTYIYIIFVLFLSVMQSCNTPKDVYIVVGDKANKTEMLTAMQLQEDLISVSHREVFIIQDTDELPEAGVVFVVGTSSSNSIISSLANREQILLSADFPGPRGGIWANLKYNNRKVLVLAGSDVQGMQYAVYDYCKNILGVDPFAYWSGNVSRKLPSLDLSAIQNKIIPSPEIPILCYFENDVDELANVKSPKLEYDWTDYTEMINSLVRLKYNAIHIFDMLGRPEFFLRPEYKKIRPDYDIRISYIDSMINYAHDMGMMVQIDMALGYKIKPLPQERADCWSQYKQDWIDTWKYYFEETPIGKADIFALRPRNQVWDWEYKSACGEDKVDVFNEVYAELGQLIDHYNPEATKVVLCYHDGMEMFNNGFNPPKDWIIAWSDNGWADFDFWPEGTKGYDFGTYMHAGFWLNHTIHDPCPIQIEHIMKKMNHDYTANKYCMVNGQQFRPFLLNLAAFSQMADDINSFDGDAFYQSWAQSYFDQAAAECAVSSMKNLHAAQFAKVGYVQHLWEIREALSYLSNSPIERPGRAPVPYDYARVENDLVPVAKRMEFIDKSLEEAQKGYDGAGDENLFYYDYIVLPVLIYKDLLSFEVELHHLAVLKREYEVTGDRQYLNQAILSLSKARTALDAVYARRMSGDKNEQWKGWYYPENRRPNNGFPTFQMLDDVEENLKSL